MSLPYMLKFLVSFRAMWGPVEPLITIDEYFDLILMVLLGLGIVFELPILIFFLSLFGIVTPKFLWKNFRYAILVIAIVAAIITPTSGRHDDADLHGADGWALCGEHRRFRRGGQ